MLKDEELEQVAKLANTSFTKMMDQYRKGLKPVFRCSHSGLYFPTDYLKKWGVRYGIGLGPDPVSEALNTDYDTLVDIRQQVPTDVIMHSVEVTRAQVDLALIHSSELDGKFLIVAEDDHAMKERAPILLRKQWENPRGQLKRYRPELAKIFGGAT